MKIFSKKCNGWYWGLSWLFTLSVVVVIFLFSHELPFILGLPLWLWLMIGMTWFTAFVFWILTRIAWEVE